MSTPPITWKGAAMADGLTTHGVGSDGTLTASPAGLTIQSPVGTFAFRPQDIVSLQRAGALPWLGAGILVRHRVPGYPQAIGFCPRDISSPELLRALAACGYAVA